MSIKKYSSGQWVDTPYRKYGTETDTITTIPTEIIGDGQSASAVIKGNLSQSGTPTPQNPIYPSETGDKTANLCDTENFANSTTDTRSFLQLAIMCYYGSDFVGRATFSGGTQLLDIKTTGNKQILFTVTAENCNRLFIKHNGATRDISISNVYGTFSGDYNISFDCNGTNPIVVDGISLENIMLNTGSTALPYEPYGIKIPISSANTTTPVYLGEVESTRKIKKYEFTGQEDWSEISRASGYRFVLTLSPTAMVSDTTAGVKSYCSHLRLGSSGETYTANNTYTIASDSQLVATLGSNDRLADWKQYLAAQYANGTPITVWYVLATPTTGTLNEPIRKIRDYADSVTGTGIPTTGTAEQFDVDTTLKPSEVSLTYHGWHEHQDTVFT